MLPEKVMQVTSVLQFAKWYMEPSALICDGAVPTNAADGSNQNVQERIACTTSPLRKRDCTLTTTCYENCALKTVFCSWMDFAPSNLWERRRLWEDAEHKQSKRETLEATNNCLNDSAIEISLLPSWKEGARGNRQTGNFSLHYMQHI